MRAKQARKLLKASPCYNESGGYGNAFVEAVILKAEEEITDTANLRITKLINRLMEYEPRIHAGECPDGEWHQNKKDCQGRSCELCKKRYYTKLKKELLKTNLL